jgi:hypothetical protein
MAHFGQLWGNFFEANNSQYLGTKCLKTFGTWSTPPPPVNVQKVVKIGESKTTWKLLDSKLLELGSWNFYHPLHFTRHMTHVRCQALPPSHLLLFSGYFGLILGQCVEKLRVYHGEWSPEGPQAPRVFGWSWTCHEQVMNKSWASHEQVMSKSWASH